MLKLTAILILIALMIVPTFAAEDEVINDFEQGSSQEESYDKPAPVPSPQPQKPRVYIPVAANRYLGDNDEWATTRRDVVKCELEKQGVAEFVLYGSRLEWANRMADYTRNSGRYRPDTTPPMGEYIAPTHQVNLTNTWKTKTEAIRIGHNRGQQKTMTITIRAEVYDLATGLMKAFSGEGKASIQYLRVKDVSLALSGSLKTRALENAAKDLVKNMSFCDPSKPRK